MHCTIHGIIALLHDAEFSVNVITLTSNPILNIVAKIISTDFHNALTGELMNHLRTLISFGHNNECQWKCVSCAEELVRERVLWSSQQWNTVPIS